MASSFLARDSTFNKDQLGKFVDGIEEDDKKLKNTYESVKAALMDAEKRHLTEDVVRVWFKRLKDISYEIEDALDVCSTILLKVKIGGADCSWFKQQAKDDKFRSRIRELNDRLDDINKEKDAYNLKSELVPAALTFPQRRKSTCFMEASTVCGRDLEIQGLVKHLCNTSQRNDGREVISVTGMGGIGKTTIAQCVYNDATVKSHFQKRIWVCVSDPFDEVQVAKSITTSLDGEPSKFTDLQGILVWINSSIAGKRYLLVLDDVWTENSSNWESLLNSLDTGAAGSKILVTTRNARCAKAIGSRSVQPLGALKPGESWKLFSQIAFFDKSKQDVENLKKIGKKIAEKCKGLPLALKAIASHLQFKSNTKREWQRVLESEIWEIETAEEQIFKPLLLSYYDFPSPIKKCFLLCAVFPKDYKFEVEELKRMWMSQGFLITSRNEDMETVGDEYFEHLFTRSFFQDEYQAPKGTGPIRYCKMHDIVHDFAQFLSKEESLIIDLENNKSDVSSSSCRKLRHLTVLNIGEDIMSSSFISSIQQRLHDLHTLRISRRSTIGEIGINFQNLSQHLCFIKALDLSKSGIVEVPEGIGQFVHLRYLDLSRNSKLKRLPETIYELCNLQTLLLYYCKSLKLPEGIEKLINLRHLANGNETILPNGIWSLDSLRMLSRFFVTRVEGHDGEVAAAAIIGDMRNLNNLEITHLKNVKDGREARKVELSNKRGLTRLRLDFEEGKGISGHENEVIEALEPCHSLEILEIGFYSGELLPSWISSLNKLRIVRLFDCEICEELPPLGQLPSLESLFIESMRSCKRIGNEFMGIKRGQTSTGGGRNGNMMMTSSGVVAFPKLKELKFADMTLWTEWEDVFISGVGGSTNIFPCLDKLKIELCVQLRSLPQFISKSPIQTLEVLNCRILEERCCPETGEDWSKISHIPNIRVDNDGYASSQLPKEIRVGRWVIKVFTWWWKWQFTLYRNWSWQNIFITAVALLILRAILKL